jgi:hypothetical protein
MDPTDAAAKVAARISDGLQWGGDRRSAGPVGRVTRVQRPTIEPDIRAETARLDEPLGAVVTRFAERLEWTEPELIDIAPVRLDVVANRRWLDDAALQAKLTKRMFEQLVPPDSRPASRGVPLIPLRRLTANAHSTQPLI